MINFDIILVMYLVHSCYVLVNCRIMIVKFQFPNNLFLEWKGSSLVPIGQFISYLNAMMMIGEGKCISSYLG